MARIKRVSIKQCSCIDGCEEVHSGLNYIWNGTLLESPTLFLEHVPQPSRANHGSSQGRDRERKGYSDRAPEVLCGDKSLSEAQPSLQHCTNRIFMVGRLCDNSLVQKNTLETLRLWETQTSKAILTWLQDRTANALEWTWTWLKISGETWK